MLIDGTHSEEVRVVVTDGKSLDEYDVETSTKRQLKGNVYLAKVTRVEPSLQAAFVDYGGNRHGFLAFSEIHPDYYQIPIEDRAALIAEIEGLPQSAKAAQAHVDEIDGGFDEEATEDSDDEAEPVVDAMGEATDDAPDDENSDENSDEDTGEAVDAAAETDVSADGDAESVVISPEENAGETEDDAEALAADAEDSGAEEDATGEEKPRRRRNPRRRYSIQEVIKRRQILLVQVVKEERGNKGAALTTYISLAGRYCVLMPNTSRGGGISRKITNATERRKLKSILNALEIEQGMGVIMRTAGLERNKTEIKRDFEFLVRAWDEVRELTLKSTAPALVYEEASLIKRAIRDLYTKDIEEVLVEGNDAYQTAKKFMRLLMPSHAKRVQPYRDETIPLFFRYQVEAQLDAMHSPTVQLKSGGYIVMHATEALVAIDVNSGRSTRERSIEETALKTNLEAADEIARQLRLRDLAGLIVIDFIDMEENRNIRAVEKRTKEAIKGDRARIQIGRISMFGLLEMSRQRLRPSLMEASTEFCPHCEGTGFMRSTESMALHVLRAIEEEGARSRSSEVNVTVATPVALYILNQKRGTLTEIEGRYGFSVTITGDNSMVAAELSLDRVKSRAAGPAPRTAVSVEDIAEEETPTGDDEAAAEAAPAQEEEEGARRKPRRRRGRRKAAEETPADAEAKSDSDTGEAEPATTAAAPSDEGDGDDDSKTRRRRRGRRGGRRRSRKTTETEETGETVAEASDENDPGAGPQPYVDAPEINPVETAASIEPIADAENGEAEQPAETNGVDHEIVETAEAAPVEPESEPEPEPEEPEIAAESDQPVADMPPAEIAGDEPKRRGWWNRRVE